MADTLLRSPDGTRERWFNEKEVAHLTTKEPGERWTVVETDEQPPRDPHDVVEDELTDTAEPTEINPTDADPAPKPAAPKPVARTNRGRGR